MILVSMETDFSKAGHVGTVKFPAAPDYLVKIRETCGYLLVNVCTVLFIVLDEIEYIVEDVVYGSNG